MDRAISIGVGILEKIISDLKSKIPFGKKPKEADEESDQIDDEITDSSQQSDATDTTDISKLKAAEDDEDLYAEESPAQASFIEKLKSKFSGLKAKSEKKEAISDEKAKKKKLFQIIIISLVGFYIASELFMPSEEESVPEVDPKSLLKPRKKPVKKPLENNAEATATDATIQPATDSTQETPATSDTDSTVPTEASAAEGTTGMDITEGEPSAPTEITPEAEASVPSSEVEAAPGPSAEQSSDTGVTSDMSDSVDGKTEEANGDNITDQILLDLERQAKDKAPVEVKKEYVSPPDYEYRGRGLVYNCLGKHWACVDAPSYKTCEDNASSVKFLQKKTECHPFSVYETVRGCEDIQNRMVSSSAATKFCNE